MTVFSHCALFFVNKDLTKLCDVTRAWEDLRWWREDIGGTPTRSKVSQKGQVDQLVFFIFFPNKHLF